MELGALRYQDTIDQLPAGRLTVTCARGARSMTAASILAATGRGDTRVLLGGTDGWAEAGLPLDRT